jgi:RNA polymerase sigma-70 factor (ECF subfamily)
MLLTRWDRDDAFAVVENRPAFFEKLANGDLEPERRLARGPNPELPLLIVKEIPFLRRSVRRWRCEEADAEDLVQDTLLRALTNTHLWQPGSDLRAWLFTIMRNQFFAVATKSSRAAAALADHVAPGVASAASPLEARLMLRDVVAALGRLPCKQRLAVLLVGIKGNSYEEAARLMGSSVSAVRCHLARGRERLRAGLQRTGARSPRARCGPAMAPHSSLQNGVLTDDPQW